MHGLAIMIVVVGFMLSGCAATRIEKGSAEEALAGAEIAARQACLESFNRGPDVSGLASAEKMFVLSQHATAQTVAAATGRSPCDSVTFRDVQLKEIGEKNATARAVSGNVTSLGTAGVAAWAATSIAASAFGAAGDTVGGDKAGGNIDKSSETTTTTETTTGAVE